MLAHQRSHVVDADPAVGEGLGQRQEVALHIDGTLLTSRRLPSDPHSEAEVCQAGDKKYETQLGARPKQLAM